MDGEPSLLRLALGAAFVLAAGASIAFGLGLGARRRLRRPAFLAIAWVLGLSILVPLLLLSGLAGLPVRAWGLALLAVGVAALGWYFRWRRPAAPESPAPAPFPTEAGPRWLALASRAVLVAAVAVFAWKVAIWPVWGWDHHAMWGVKARRMVVDGRLDLSFLASDGMRDARPDRPIGFSAMPLLLTLGGLPDDRTFKLLHLSLGLSLLVLLREGLARVGLRGSAADALTAWAAALPLFWDTEALGQAEMPLALWLVAAAVLLLPSRRETGAPRFAGWAGGIVLGFLPWIKQEGSTLAAVLAVAAIACLPREAWGRALRSMLPPTLLLGGLNLWFYQTQLAPGVGFTSGDPLARLAERLPAAASLVAYMARSFLLPDALGFWLAFALALGVALWQRRTLALGLAGVVTAQLLIYMAVTFIVFLPPRAHVDAAFSRIIAALMPLAMLAVGAVLAPRESRRPVRARPLRPEDAF